MRYILYYIIFQDNNSVTFGGLLNDGHLPNAAGLELFRGSGQLSESGLPESAQGIDKFDLHLLSYHVEFYRWLC